MPYLHWETNRTREIFARYIEKTVNLSAKPNSESKSSNHPKTMIFRRHRLTGKMEDSGEKRAGEKEDDKKKADAADSEEEKERWEQPKDFRDLLDEKLPLIDYATNRVTFGSQSGIKDSRKIRLLQFLLDAARLYEAIANFRDKKLIQNCLNIPRPLHPRRTLDQAHYWTLNPTCADERDRDQVIYRGTTVKWDDSEHAHKINWPLLRKVADCPEKYARPKSHFKGEEDTKCTPKPSTTNNEATAGPEANTRPDSDTNTDTKGTSNPGNTQYG